MPGLDSRATVPGPMISLSGAWRGRWRQTDLRQAPAMPRTSCVILDKSLNSLGTVSSSIKWAITEPAQKGWCPCQDAKDESHHHSALLTREPLLSRCCVLQQKLAQAPRWPLSLYPRRHCPRQGALCWVAARGVGATDEIHAGVFHA